LKAERLKRSAGNPRDEGLEERRRVHTPSHIPATTLKISQFETARKIVRKIIFTLAK
jgi:hypothetical protein